MPAAEAAAAKIAAATAPAPASELPGVPAGAVPAAPSKVSAPAPAGSLDALSLAKGIAAEQLSSPGKVLAFVAVVACVSYWARRCSAFRLVRAVERMKIDRA